MTEFEAELTRRLAVSLATDSVDVADRVTKMIRRQRRRRRSLGLLVSALAVLIAASVVPCAFWAAQARLSGWPIEVSLLQEQGRHALWLPLVVFGGILMLAARTIVGALFSAND